MKLSNKIALITGGASGIGEATTKLFSREGAICIIADLDEVNGNRVSKEINGYFYKMDVSNRDNVNKVVTDIINKQNRIDILINSAGFAYPSTPVSEFPDDIFEKIISVNLIGTYNICKAVVIPMLKQGSGRIVNVSSAAGIHCTALKSAYSASKAGVNAFTKVLAREVGKKGVIVNAVCPGVIITPMTTKGGAAVEGSPFYNWWQQNCPMGRLGEADETARLVLFFSCDDSGFITGQSILQDGGFV